MLNLRHYSLLDKIFFGLDQALRTLNPPAKREISRPSPAEAYKDEISAGKKQEVAGLMRVNHAGEVCAQALYHGQALAAKSLALERQMLIAAEEEADHLGWCEQRLQELGSQPSKLNPFWYVNSFILGALAGFISDSYSLGFVAETERQVSTHLQGHLALLPKQDKKTRVVIEEMYKDEVAHEIMATQIGAKELPNQVKNLMRLMAKIMTTTSFYI